MSQYTKIILSAILLFSISLAFITHAAHIPCFKDIEFDFIRSILKTVSVESYRDPENLLRRDKTINNIDGNGNVIHGHREGGFF
jgi:hypothetical protein